MAHLGDYTEDFATLNHKFTTRDADGAPTNPVDLAVKVYTGSATGTEIDTGVTLSTTGNFDGITGLNNLLIDLSADALYAVGADYHVVVTAGTVDAVSIIGEVICTFSIENRFDEVDVVKWLGQACAAVGVNGVPKVDLTYILAHLLTQGAGDQLANGFEHFFDHGTPAITVGDAMVGTNAANTVVPPSVVEFEARTIVSEAYFVVGDYSVPLDAAGIRTAVGLGSANLDTQLGDIPTVAEFEARSIVAGNYFVVGDYTAPDNTNIGNIYGIVNHGTHGNAKLLRTGADGDTGETLSDQLDTITITAADVADAVWDEEQGDHTNAATFGKYLDTAVSGIGGATGSGSNTCTLTIKDVDSVVVDGAAVWISTDENGANVVAGTKYSSATGIVTFMLDDGDYWCWKQAAGHAFDNPEEFTVAG